jgi:hypothetical protein
MQGHGLMQAIARVNRVFRDKPGGLVVDYLGLADQLKQALATYTESGGAGVPTYDTRQAIAVMLEKHGIASDMLHGFNWGSGRLASPRNDLRSSRRDRSTSSNRPMARSASFRSLPKLSVPLPCALPAMRPQCDPR